MTTKAKKEDLKIKFKNYNIEIKQGKVEAFYCEDRKARIFKSIINIKVNEEKTRFFFYGSINDFQNHKRIYDLQELAFCLYCFLSDSLSAQESFTDFCNELGYDNDSRNAYKIYKACARSLNKANRLFYWEDINEVVNYLQENFDC